MAILVRRPDRMRVEVLSLLGASLILTVAGDELLGFHPRERVLYRGKSSKEVLAKYTHIPLELGQLTSVLLGLPPLSMQGPWTTRELSSHRLSLGKGPDVVFFDPVSGLPAGWNHLSPGGEVELDVSFADFLSTPAGMFPSKITLESHGGGVGVEIVYDEPEINVSLPGSLFAQRKPAGVREIPLGDMGG